ncbi:MAG: hypothetical protein KKB50_22015 [Planctomycetes bacterium]|nr:hypothetical protein [Planctomycetota bacterium]
MAYGWSVHPEGGKAAIDEAIAMMQKSLHDPTLIVLYTTAGYGEAEKAATLRSRFPRAKLFGMNVYKGVLSSDGLHSGEKGSLAIMGLADGDLVCGISVREVPDGADVVSHPVGRGRPRQPAADFIRPEEDGSPGHCG